MEIFAITLGTFAVVGSAVYAALAPRVARAEDVVRSRLAAIADAAAVPAGVTAPEAREGFWERAARFFVDRGGSPERDSGVGRLLHQGGYSGERAPRILLGVRIVLAIGTAVVAFTAAAFLHASFARTLLGVGAAAAVGYVVPLVWVKRQARLRLRDVEETFPDTLDLLVVCVEAGLGIDAALVRVADEQASHGLAIGDELRLTCREAQAGIPRREALTRMAARLESDYVRSLTGFLIQTEELGGSIARSLKVYAETMRQRRRQRAEEHVRKTVIRLLLPLALLIMPALFLVVFAPPAVNIVKFVDSPQGK
jgi:tight adherence protein C